MSDYIKREDAIFVALQHPISTSLISEIKQLDGIDLVRCKECDNTLRDGNEIICHHLSGTLGCNVLVQPDDYCSYGVRKTNTTAEEKPTPIRDYMVYGKRREP